MSSSPLPLPINVLHSEVLKAWEREGLKEKLEGAGANPVDYWITDADGVVKATLDEAELEVSTEAEAKAGK